MKTTLLGTPPVWIGVVVVLSMKSVLGQTPGTGAIAGSVYDSTNRAISNANVLAVNEATHVSRSGATNMTGGFQCSLLPPGAYLVTAEAQGFKKNTSAAIQVTASQITSVNFSLAVATVDQNVQVKVSEEETDLESSALGGLVNEAAIQSLPLSNRNFTQILGLAPGVGVDLPNATALGSGPQNAPSDGATPTANNIQC